MYFTSTTFHSIPSNQQPFFSSIRPGAWGSKGGVATDQCQLNSSNLYRTRVIHYNRITTAQAKHRKQTGCIYSGWTHDTLPLLINTQYAMIYFSKFYSSYDINLFVIK